MRVLTMTQPVGEDGKLMRHYEIEGGDTVHIDDVIDFNERRLQKRLRDLNEADVKYHHALANWVNIQKDINRIRRSLYFSRLKKKLSTMLSPMLSTFNRMRHRLYVTKLNKKLSTMLSTFKRRKS